VSRSNKEEELLKIQEKQMEEKLRVEENKKKKLLDEQKSDAQTGMGKSTSLIFV
jgi:hypothetical protein